MIRDRRPNNQSNYKEISSKPNGSIAGRTFYLDSTSMPSAIGIMFRIDQIAIDRSNYPGPGIAINGSTFNQSIIPDNNPLNMRENLPDIVISGPLEEGYTNSSSFPPSSSGYPIGSESSSSSSSNSFSSSSTSRTASISSSSNSDSESSSESSSRTQSSSSSGLPSSLSSSSESTPSSSTSSDNSISSHSFSSVSTSSNEEFTSSSSNTPSSNSTLSGEVSTSTSSS